MICGVLAENWGSAGAQRSARRYREVAALASAIKVSFKILSDRHPFGLTHRKGAIALKGATSITVARGRTAGGALLRWHTEKPGAPERVDQDEISAFILKQIRFID